MGRLINLQSGFYTRNRTTILATLPICTAILLVLVLLILWMRHTGFEELFPEVALPFYGIVKGSKIMSSNEIYHYSFRGIPYAKPPVGDLRFKAPVNPEPWKEPLYAVAESNDCSQYSPVKKTFKGDEDCLYLDVITPQLPGDEPLKPVMVFIHGGTFQIGTGNSLLQNPIHLVEAGVVYVSFNYRLDVFGFLSTQDSSIPGNAGLKDQVQVLRWVQENIAAFGGDPRKVTIFGHSSGGVSVYYHILSPMSRGLFHRAISMSASVTSPSNFVTNPRDYAFKLARTLKLSVNTSGELLDALQNIEAEKIMTAVHDQVPEQNNLELVPSVYKPSLETVVDGEVAFLPDSPSHLLDKGNFIGVPFMTGLTSQEGIALLLSLNHFIHNQSLEDVDKNFSGFFKHYLRYCQNDTCGDSMLDKIRSFYFKDKPISKNTVKNFVELCTDMFIAEGTIYAANEIAARTYSPVYLYQFSYDGRLSLLKRILTSYNISGAAHGDELLYIFKIPVVFPDDEMDSVMRSRMIKLWTDFAKTGNPTPEPSDDIPSWVPYTRMNTNYLNIDSQIEVKRDLNKERMDFWRFLYSSFQS